MKFLLLFGLILFLFACEESKPKDKYVLEKKSEMAQMMLDMHKELGEVQTKIKSGEDLGDFPETYKGLSTATMTDESMREEGFEAFALHLIETEKKLYKAETTEKQEAAYKEVVQSCINCHTNVGCKGPIPKIEKLSWKE